MKIVIAILILLICGAIYFFVNKKHEHKLNVHGDSIGADSSVNVNNPFDDLRNMAFSISPSEIGINVPDTEVYGVIMDWNISEGIMTLVSYQNGDASLYLSTGGGFIGGGNKENISSAAKLLVKKAQIFIDRANLISRPSKTLLT